MDKNEYIQNHQDALRSEEPNPLTKAVVTRQAAFGAMLSAKVSPCSWLNKGVPFQITVQMGGGGKITVQDKTLAFDEAAIRDMQRLLDEVDVVECSSANCSRPAFNPSQFPSNRAGQCEVCFLQELDSTLGSEIKDLATERAQAVALKDSIQKAQGYTHRVNATFHMGGDDLELAMYMSNPTKAEIISKLKTNGCVDGNFVVTRL